MRAPRRRAPVSPSSTCEVCRAYYKEETQLENELIEVMQNFPQKMAERERELLTLKKCSNMWEGDPNPALSPDIQKLYLKRKQRVMGLLHDSYNESAQVATKWIERHERACAHQRKVSANKPPPGSPRLYTDNAERNRRQSMDSAYKGGKQLVRLPDGTYANEATGTYQRRWFHQDPVIAQIRVRKSNIVDAAEDCSQLISRRQIKSLQAETNILSAQLRDELVRQRSLSPHIGQRQKRIVSKQSRIDAAATILEEPVGSYEQSVGDISNDMQLPYDRTLGDFEYWQAATRAQALPDELSISRPITSPSMKDTLLSAGSPVADFGDRAEMSKWKFLQNVESIQKEPPSSCKPSRVSQPSPNPPAPMILPMHPLAPAAQRLQTAQRHAVMEINSGLLPHVPRDATL